MKAKSIFLVFISLTILLFNSCNTKNSENTIKIGVILPLTGKLSVIGEGEKKGIQFALDSIKVKFPEKNIEVIFEDFASETKNAVTLANKLIDIDKVNIIITSTTAAAEAVTPVINQNNIIHFVISPDVEILSKSKQNYRVYYNFNTEANVLNQFLIKDSIKNIAFLAVKYSSIQKEINDKIKPFLSNNNISIFDEEYFDITEKDFKTYIFKIKQFSPQAIFLAPQVNQVEILSNQLFETELKPNDNLKLYASFTYNWVPTDFLNKLENYKILSPRFQVEDTTNNYYKIFASRYNVKPNFDMMFAYDNMMIILNVLEGCKNNLNNFESVFNTQNEYTGASGKIRFVGNRDTDVEIVMTQIINNKQVIIK